ncbi:DNA sulfur modification protein DndD [Acidithiobacillus sp. HP-6]|uniref:DNA sulfur modification protein DndD n=1 Tax=unclassified Acidithiobacillus TaxID=2614800 RepID=UPI00187A1AB6|nr:MULTISPECIES: DNA sulfur modification protein DndD [unclassified Acidithiobacillus]MBE7562010.1 DNA sulfur modification protein DndD [Acidithiobacillus sp. HP-6]MBE7568682.1 DNA sulfur modification protein DndD [Acidithiobacillus sp. HP-2]
MAKITITNVSIENLGPFRERQTIDLGVGAGKPVILVKALNGSGKTTLLTALQIGLYGQKALPWLKRTEYEQLLLGLQRHKAQGHSIVEIGIVVEVSGARRQLMVRREWPAKADGLQEKISVYEDGSLDIDFSQTWDEFIESILPAELVQLFLFDGEKIEALANPERLPELLKRATEVFLGIGGIEALGNDLKAFERRTTLKNKNVSEEFEAARANVATWNSQASELEMRIQHLTQDLASARNAADQAQNALDRYTVEAQRKGLVAYEQAAAIRNAVEVTRKTVSVARSNLADAMSDPILPLAWLTSLWPSYVDAWERDQHARHSKLLEQEFKKRDGRVLSALPANLSKSAIDALKDALALDLKAYSANRDKGGPYLRDAPPKDVERQLTSSRSQVRRELDALKAAQVQLDRTEQRIGEIPAEEQIGDILSVLSKRSKVTAAAEAQLTALTQQLEEAQSNLAHVRMRLNAAQERLGTEFRDRSLEAKSLEASVRARKVLSVFKDRLLASKAQWLSDVITAEFRDLLRKKNLIASVVVDPSSYQVTIKDSKQQELPMDRLSAGERQLLAISVLSALIKERKGRFPVVVDTPLARLDQQHRSAMIKRFFATVSHQVVVLSTDQEVDGSAYDALKPFTNAEYSLDFDDGEGRTTVNFLGKERGVDGAR